MENSICKLRAAALIASAIQRECKQETEQFSLCCDRYADPTVCLITAFEALGYRERVMIGMRLGFDCENNYQPTPPHKYNDLATAFELTLPASASKICRKAYAKIVHIVSENLRILDEINL